MTESIPDLKSPDSKSERPVDAVIKKRRGRPPGSKNRNKEEEAKKMVEEAKEMMQEAHNSVAAPAVHRTKEQQKQDYLNEEVHIEFMNLEEPGMMLNFTYGTTKDKKKYSLFHGGKYTLPRKVVQHIESRQTPIWKYRPDGEGSMKKELMSWKPRFQCRQVFE